MDKLERIEDLNSINSLSDNRIRQAYPVGDGFGQVVQAVRDLPVAITFPEFLSAVILTATSGDNEIIATAPPGFRYVIWGWNLVAEGAVEYSWESGASGTPKTGDYALSDTSDGMLIGPAWPIPQFKCDGNQSLNLELSDAVEVNGVVQYSLEAV